MKRKRSGQGKYFLNADELTGKAEEISTDEHTNQLVSDHTETKDDITTKSQSDESRQQQQRIAEQFATNREETSQLSTEPDKKRYQEKLKEFMQSEDELVEPVELLPEETLQHQQSAAQQPIEKEELVTSEPTEEQAIQKLILEQKEIRERYRQKVKKRVR